MLVGVIVQAENLRSQAVCTAMAHGISSCGDTPVPLFESQYNGQEYDVIVFYGMKGRLRQAFNDYRRHKKAVYIDLGYWGRTDGGRRAGYHKVVVNARHPTGYFMQRKHPHDRAHRLGIYPKPWQQDGRHILLAGMGAKAATFEGFLPEQWELAAATELRRHSDRPIVYRPKPNWESTKGVPGTIFSPESQSLREVLENCHAVVTHHSNVGVDGLVEGVPVFTVEGVALAMGSSDLSKIENPEYPTKRQKWIADIAYCQWNVEEMREGKAWRHLKDEGLVP